MTVAESVTDNVSRTVVTPVSRNECTACDQERSFPAEARSWIGHPHCTTCHADYHRACVECGTCMKPLGRWDRFYCSSTCRQKVYHWRRGPEALAERAASEARWASPEGRTHSAKLKALDSVLADSEELTARKALQKRARDTALTCGRCGIDLPPTQPVWRRPDINGRVLPVCYGCRCDRFDHRPGGIGSRCDRCRPDGSWRHVRWSCPDVYRPDHGGTYCASCHPLAWRDPAPCEGCGRTVINAITVRPGYRWSKDRNGYREYEWGRYVEGKHVSTARTFCGDSCRRSIERLDYRVRRAAERDPAECPTCAERFDHGRRDSRYCSAACRQKAYRARRAS